MNFLPHSKCQDISLILLVTMFKPFLQKVTLCDLWLGTDTLLQHNNFLCACMCPLVSVCLSFCVVFCAHVHVIHLALCSICAVCFIINYIPFLKSVVPTRETFWSTIITVTEEKKRYILFNLFKVLFVAHISLSLDLIFILYIFGHIHFISTGYWCSLFQSWKYMCFNN